MNTDQSLQRLLDRGFEEVDAKSRLAMIERVSRRHQDAFGHRGFWCWVVPGRIEIFGKHTDYAGGRSRLAAVPRGVVIAASPRDDGTVRFADAIANVTGTIVTEPADAAAEHGAGYIAAVARRFALNFPGAALGANLTIGSDLPRAAGLSSSSALVVGTALALIRRAELDTRPEWIDAIRTPDDLAAYLGALERGAPFRDLAGTHAVGVLGGSEDHTAILSCQPRMVSAYRFIPIDALGDAAMPQNWRFVIATSGVIADKAGSARSAYNQASQAAEALLELWHSATDGEMSTLASIIASAPDAAARLSDLARRGSGDFSGESLQRRLAHFVAEDGRILDALAAFGSADEGALGSMASASQSDAETLLRNQTDETSALAELALAHGAFAASSFGAGFGGSVWALARAEQIQAFGRRWLEAYRARFPARADADWFAARPGPAAFEWE
jgi:galactokinase